MTCASKMEVDRPRYKVYWIIIICVFRNVQSATLNDSKTLIGDLLTGYNVNVRPVANQSEAVSVTIVPYIKSIQEFDEVNGRFSFVGALLVTWHDANMMWDPSKYGGLVETTVLYPNVWVPELILSSPSNAVGSLGQKWNRIRYFYNGYALWLPVDLFESTCSVNVKNYPFDIQECVTSFISLGYQDYEVRLIAGSNEFSFEVYQENSLWTVNSSSVIVSEMAGGYQISLSLVLKRKPSFVIINVIMPILFLSLLNVLVFLLVPQSGERVSYCITVLLAIAVFMTIVSDMLPRSSEPVPIVSYKLMIDMVLSSFIVFCTIINLDLYHREDSVPVPAWLTRLYRQFSCSGRIQKQVSPEPADKKKVKTKSEKIQTINVVEFEANMVEMKINQMVQEATDEMKPVTWRLLSEMLDKIFLVLFTFASVASFVIFITVTAVSA